MKLFDNSYSSPIISDSIRPLFKIANKSIAELCADNDKLLVFPHSLGACDDRISESTILNFKTTDSPEKVVIQTGNIMGFVGVGGLRLKIQSRFDNGRGDFLLHYMLQRVMSLNVFNLNYGSDTDDVFDMMLFMFPFLLKAALRQGLYREYQNYTHNDANVKGTIDISRHLARNIPFAGNVAYHTREYSCDNSLTQLIRHTIELMKTKHLGRAALALDSETIDAVADIVYRTPTYCKAERQPIIQRNLRSKIHPYYTAYRPLQSLCVSILRMEEIKYGESSDEINGILFDGAWLWEEYLNTILSPEGFIHPENKKERGAIYLFKDPSGDHYRYSGRRYPDFYKQGYVLDAKYKRLGNYELVSQAGRDDVHQILAYMAALKADRGAFVAPLQKCQSTPPTSKIIDSQSTVSILGVEISREASSYADFCSAMRANEAQFLTHLHSL